MHKYYKHINVGYWTIHSLVEKGMSSGFNKLSDNDFTNILKRMDLFCLSETHIGLDFDVILENFHTYKSCRKLSANNRFFGGLCVFTSVYIKNGVKVIKNDHQDIIWLKLSKDFFKLDRDIYICFTYISPSNSIYFKHNDFDSDTIFDLIKQDCAEFMVKGKVLIMGDFNAYVPNDSLDYIGDDDSDDHIPIPNDIYCPDIPLERKTMEFRELNKNGKALLDLCKTVFVRIVNERVVGDESGRFTRFPMNQNPNNSYDSYPSILDYTISDPTLLKEIKYLSVSDLTRFSDHCVIKLSIQTNFTIDGMNISDSQFPWAPSKHVWNNQYKVLLGNVFRSEDFQSALNQFSKKLYNIDQTGVDSATEDLSKIIVSATESVIPRKPNMRKKTIYKRKWFDKNCSQLRSELKR